MVAMHLNRTWGKIWGYQEGRTRSRARSVGSLFVFAIVACALCLIAVFYPTFIFASAFFICGMAAGLWLMRPGPAEAKAVSEATLHAKVFLTTADGATITDAEGNILAVNDAFTRLTGYGRAEVIGKNPSILSSGLHDDAFYNQMWGQIATGGYWEGEVYNRHKDGEVYAEWLRISKVPDPDGGAPNYIGIFSDITARKATEEHLYQRAYSDALTGAANRPYLNKYLDQEMPRVHRQASCLAVLFLDLDKFKPINDKHGHAAGDEVLRVIVDRIRGELRENDLVTRIGGDEFVVALSDSGSADGALQVASRILAMVSRPITWQGHEFHVCCSGGVAIYPDHADDRNALIAAADKAMYKAKARGGNYVALAERAPPQRKNSFA